MLTKMMICSLSSFSTEKVLSLSFALVRWQREEMKNWWNISLASFFKTEKLNNLQRRKEERPFVNVNSFYFNSENLQNRIISFARLSVANNATYQLQNKLFRRIMLGYTFV